jgi:hypothetical protein
MRILVILGMLWTLGASLPASDSTSAAPPQRLFEAFTPKQKPEGRDVENYLEYRPVQVRFRALDALREGDRLELNLLPDYSLIAIIDRIERHDEQRTSYFGHLDGIDHPYSHIILTRVNDVLAATIYSPPLGIEFGVIYHRDGYHLVYRPDPTKRGGCGTGDTPEPSAEITPSPEPSQTDSKPSSESSEGDFSPAGDFEPAGCGWNMPMVDVMVVYTPAIRTTRGSHDAVVAAAQLGVDVSNIIYQNSNIPLRMRLVFVGEVSYNEGTDTFRTHRDRLQNASDGFMDIVHTWRNQYRADDVVLFVADNDCETGQCLCGVAYCQRDGWGGHGPWEDKAFCVVQGVNNNCLALGGAAFTHEIGHNQGCGHNRADAGCCVEPLGCGICALCSRYNDSSYGWRGVTTLNNRYITVMSYQTNNDFAGGCTGGDYRGAPEIPFFSTPTITYEGTPIGFPAGGCGADNRLVIMDFRCHRDSYRILDCWVNFGWTGSQNGTICNPFNTVTAAVSAMPSPAAGRLVDFPTLYIVAGSRRETITINKRMRIEACGGTVRIGAP